METFLIAVVVGATLTIAFLLGRMSKEKEIKRALEKYQIATKTAQVWREEIEELVKKVKEDSRG